MAQLDVKDKYANITLNLNGVKYKISQAFEFPEQNLSVKESLNRSRKKTILFGDIPIEDGENLQFKEIGRGGNGAVYQIGNYAVKVNFSVEAKEEAEGMYNFRKIVKDEKKKHFPEIYGYGTLTKVDGGDPVYFYSMEMINGIKLTKIKLNKSSGDNSSKGAAEEAVEAAEAAELEAFKKSLESNPLKTKFPALADMLSITNASNSSSEIKLDTKEKVMEVFKQICDAIKCIHDAKRFHGDLKPDNIMIEKGNNIKIIDMSCIKAGKHTDDICQKLFTLAYISPERSVVLGGNIPENIEPLTILKQSDIWVLGIILVNLITQYDFIGSSKKEQMHVAFKIYKLPKENYTSDDYFNIFGYKFTEEEIIIEGLKNSNMVELVKNIFTKKEGQIKTINALIDKFNAAIEDRTSGANVSGAQAGAVTKGLNLLVNGGKGGGRKKRISKKKGRYSKKKKVRYSKKKKINSKRKRRS